MLRRGDVTVELHTELLVSQWSALVPAAAVLRRAMFRPTCGGPLLLADDTDAFVHLVAHAQLREETYVLFGLRLRALYETAQGTPRRSSRRMRANGSRAPASSTSSTPTTTPPTACWVRRHRRPRRPGLRCTPA
jgi:hypothetical protein